MPYLCKPAGTHRRAEACPCISSIHVHPQQLCMQHACSVTLALHQHMPHNSSTPAKYRCTCATPAPRLRHTRMRPQELAKATSEELSSRVAELERGEKVGRDGGGCGAAWDVFT